MTWLLFATAATLFFLSLLIVIPAPTMMLLPLGVGATELSPVLLVAAVVTAGLAWRGGGPLQNAALALAAVGAGFFAIPLAQYPRDVPLSPRPLVLGLTTGEVSVTRGVLFAAPDGVALTLDVYRPTSPHRSPLIVQIYGGAWQRGAPGRQRGVCQALCRARLCGVCD